MDIDAVCERLDRIVAAINSSQSNLQWVFWGALLWFSVPSIFSHMWHSKVRYAIENSVDYSQVNAKKEPANCNFFRAPVGGKGCHYDRQIAVTRVKDNQFGAQDISYDDGQTWARHAKTVTACG